MSEPVCARQANNSRVLFTQVFEMVDLEMSPNTASITDPPCVSVAQRQAEQSAVLCREKQRKRSQAMLPMVGVEPVWGAPAWGTTSWNSHSSQGPRSSLPRAISITSSCAPIPLTVLPQFASPCSRPSNLPPLYGG
jgi:hypothetical protein